MEASGGQVKGCLAFSVDGDALIVARIAVDQICDLSRAIMAFRDEQLLVCLSVVVTASVMHRRSTYTKFRMPSLSSEM